MYSQLICEIFLSSKYIVTFLNTLIVIVVGGIIVFSACFNHVLNLVLIQTTMGQKMCNEGCYLLFHSHFLDIVSVLLQL